MRALIKPRSDVGFELADVPIPSIGPRDVLIKVLAASICGSDIPVYNWDDPWVRDTIHPGQIIGHEFCGEVVDVGEEVHEFAAVDFVTAEGHLSCGTCSHCRRGEAHVCPSLKLLGFERPGAFAEYVSVPASNVIRLERIPLILASILDPFGNAVHAAMKVPLGNTTVLITGCGPIGLMMIVLCKFLGVRRIFATEVSEYRRELAKQLGADYVMDPRAGDSWENVRRETAYDSGVDVFFEMSGSPIALKDGFSVLRAGGQAILMGLAKEPILFDFANDIVAKGISVHGIVGRLMYTTWDHTQKLLNSQHNPRPLNLLPIITHRFMIDEYETAMELINAGRCGKVILFPDAKVLQKSYDEILGSNGF